jgi:hypothetical protein
MIDGAAWERICAAAMPHKPDAMAREVLDKTLWEYSAEAGLLHTGVTGAPHFADPPRFFKDTRAAWKDVAESIKAAEKNLNSAASRMMRIRDTRLLGWGRWDEADQENLHQMWWAQRRAQEKVKAINAFLRARQRWQNPAREQLCQRLFQIWETHFGGELKFANTDGLPCGPLIRFAGAIFGDALLEPVTPWVVRDAILRERERRKR